MKKIVVVLLLLMPLATWAQDIKGGKDHRFITRYPGSVIKYYEEQDFHPYKIAVGPQTGYKKIDKWIEAEGKFTRIYYVLNGAKTITEVYRNYLSALQKGGFTILANGVNDKRNVGKEVGGRTFLGTAYIPNPYPTGKGIMLHTGSSTVGGTCYIAGMVKKAGAKAYIVISGSQYKEGQLVFMVDVIEEIAMDDGLITVDADEMKRGIEADGKIALYGIYFDKAVVKPESQKALEQIAQMLNNNSWLKLYIVGHTDMKGAFSYNITLSEQRAKAVVSELVSKYGIASSRLTPDGAGPLCPVSTNRTEAGRKLNRRVELVAK